MLEDVATVKYVPEWFPGAAFKRQAREWRVFAEAMVTAPAGAVRDAMVGPPFSCYPAIRVSRADQRVRPRTRNVTGERDSRAVDAIVSIRAYGPEG